MAARIPIPALLALVGALAWLIPVVGAALAVILPLLVGLLTSVQLSLFTVLYTLVVLIALEVWVEPRLFKRKWDNPILTLVILLAMADAFGLARHHCSAAFIGCMPNPVESPGQPPPGFRGCSSGFRSQRTAGTLWATIKEMDEPPPPLVTSSMERLTDLIEKAEPILQAALPAEPSDLFHPSQPVTGEDGSPISQNLNERVDMALIAIG